MHDIAALCNKNTSKTYKKHSKTCASSCKWRYCNKLNKMRETELFESARNALASSSFAGTCNTFPRVRTRALTNKQTNEQTKIEKENKKKRWNITQDILSPSSTLTHRSRDKYKQILIHLIPQNMGFKKEVENQACRRGSASTHGKSILAKIA